MTTEDEELLIEGTFNQETFPIYKLEFHHIHPKAGFTI